VEDENPDFIDPDRTGSSFARFFAFSLIPAKAKIQRLCLEACPPMVILIFGLFTGKDDDSSPLIGEPFKLFSNFPWNY
jgi:hypothetical protein